MILKLWLFACDSIHNKIIISHFKTVSNIYNRLKKNIPFVKMVYMRIIFSDHARQQMKERNILENQILHAIENPQRIITQLKNRFKIVSVVSQRKKSYALIVIYDLNAGRKEIVTAFISSKLKKYL